MLHLIRIVSREIDPIIRFNQDNENKAGTETKDKDTLANQELLSFLIQFIVKILMNNAYE